MGKSGYNMRNLLSTSCRYPICMDVNEMTIHSINIKCKIEMVKGQLRNPELQQPTNYSGMVYQVKNSNNTIIEITPTDVDGLLELEGKLAVFKEYKYKGLKLETSQHISFSNLCSGLVAGTYNQAITLHIGHYDGDAEQIDCGKGIVIDAYIGTLNAWSPRFNGLTADEATRIILAENGYTPLTPTEIKNKELQRNRELFKMLENI